MLLLLSPLNTSKQLRCSGNPELQERAIDPRAHAPAQLSFPPEQLCRTHAVKSPLRFWSLLLRAPQRPTALDCGLGFGAGAPLSCADSLSITRCWARCLGETAVLEGMFSRKGVAAVPRCLYSHCSFFKWTASCDLCFPGRAEFSSLRSN